MTTNHSLPIDKLLSRLQKVTAKKPPKDGLNQWQALCPAHADKSPSLIITECTDNTVLLKCWSGCTASEIVRALGLELKDLFKYEPTNKQGSSNPSFKERPSQQAIQHEKLIVSIAEASLTKGQQLTNTDQYRYQLALQRLKRLQHVN